MFQCAQVVVSEKHKLHELQAGRRVALLREISVSSFDEGFSTIKLRQIFRAFDLDHDGHIAHRELQEGLLARACPPVLDFLRSGEMLFTTVRSHSFVDDHPSSYWCCLSFVML